MQREEGNRVIFWCGENCQDEIDPCYIVVSVKKKGNTRSVSTPKWCILDHLSRIKWVKQED